LRQIAGAQMRRERAQTWQPTVLVHEVYLRLAQNRSVDWNDRRHFFAVAARTMRRLLVDRARRRGAQKRGGGAPVTLSDAMVGSEVRDDETLAVDQALEQLYRFDSLKGWIVELRFFGGYSLEETAEVVGVSRASVVRQWRVARAWLFRALDPGATDGD
jgi:RNA polymerase sigma factor (TIGR02999 family)